MIKFTHSNTDYIPFLQFLGTGFIVGALLFDVGGSLWWWFLPPVVYFLTGCLGITRTYHRLLAHRSFRAPKWVEYVGSVLGALGGTGSPIGWVFLHRRHHRYADTPLDPHSPVHQGVSVLFGSYKAEFNKFEVRDLILDPFHRFIHEYYYGLLLLWGTVLTLVGGFPLLMFGFIIPATIQIWMSNLSNYFNHSNFGNRDYETDDNSRNIPCLKWLTWGEGSGHNYHHRFPHDWKFDENWKNDPTAWTIKAFV